jgi:hypothetical protein
MSACCDICSRNNVRLYSSNCSECGRAHYCSRACYLKGYGHREKCKNIEGFIAVPKTSSDAERQRLRDVHSVRDGTVYGEFVTGEKDDEIDADSSRLNQVIALLSGVADTRAGWHADGTTFFFSLGDNLRRIAGTALIPYNSVKKALASEMERWLAVNPPPPGLIIVAGPSEQRNAAIYARWLAHRADRSADSPADQNILFLQQKKEALRRLIAACNKLLGPSESLRQRGRNLPLVLASLSDEERSIYEGLDAWWTDSVDNDDPGIYLNLDWHDIPTPGRAELSGRQTLEVPVVAQRPKRGVKASTVVAQELPTTRSILEYEPEDRVIPNDNNALDGQRLKYQVSRARHAWVATFRNTLSNFRTAVIGMERVKESVGELIQNLWLWETHSGFLNFGIFGNPGTGKTYLSSKLSEILYRMGYAPVKTQTYIRLTKPDFIAPFQGQSGHLTRLAMLRGLGSFVAIDESYDLISGSSDSYGKEALTQIVNDMDEYKV